MSEYSLARIGPEIEDAAAVAILAHGRGGSPEDMARLARAFEAPDWLCPDHGFGSGKG